MQHGSLFLSGSNWPVPGRPSALCVPRQSQQKQRVDKLARGSESERVILRRGERPGEQRERNEVNMR